MEPVDKHLLHLNFVSWSCAVLSPLRELFNKAHGWVLFAINPRMDDFIGGVIMAAGVAEGLDKQPRLRLAGRVSVKKPRAPSTP